VPQTKRLVSNFQQFFDGELYRKIVGEDEMTLDEFSNGPEKIDNDVIQGTFTFRAHDGALPGPDAKKVAALTRMTEGMQLFPQVFAPGEGNIDPRRVFLDLARASGSDPVRLRWRTADIQKVQAQAAQAAQAAQQQPKPIPPVKPSLSVSAKLGDLTTAERFQLMADVGINESGTGGPLPPGVPPPHPGGPMPAGGPLSPSSGPVPQPPLAGQRPSHMMPRHAHPGPKAGLASSILRLKHPSMAPALPPQVRPANT